MTFKRATGVAALSLGLAVMSGSRAWSQETGKPKDEALDSLLQKLADPADGPAAQREKSAKPDRPSSKGVESGKPEGPSPKENRPAKASEPSRKAEEPAARARNQGKPADGKAAIVSAAPHDGGKNAGAAPPLLLHVISDP